MASAMLDSQTQRGGAPRMSMRMAGSRRMMIDITADVICPHSLIGVRELLEALDRWNDTRPTLPIQAYIRLHPFQIEPALTEAPVQRRAFLREKFGPRADDMEMAMARKMADKGYEYALDGQISSSHLAHRLQMYTLKKFPQKQLAIAMDMFEMYHVGGIHPSDRSALAEVALYHQIFASEAAALDWLEGNECDADVKRAYRFARKVGIDAVPFVVLQDEYAGRGALGVDGFIYLIEEVIKRESRAERRPTIAAVGHGGQGSSHESMRPSPTSTTANSHGQGPLNASVVLRDG